MIQNIPFAIYLEFALPHLNNVGRNVSIGVFAFVVTIDSLIWNHTGKSMYDHLLNKFWFKNNDSESKSSNEKEKENNETNANEMKKMNEKDEEKKDMTKNAKEENKEIEKKEA